MMAKMNHDFWDSSTDGIADSSKLNFQKPFNFATQVMKAVGNIQTAKTIQQLWRDETIFRLERGSRMFGNHLQLLCVVQQCPLAIICHVKETISCFDQLP